MTCCEIPPSFPVLGSLRKEKERICRRAKKYCMTQWRSRNVPGLRIDSHTVLGAKIRLQKPNLGLPRHWFSRLAAARRHQVADVFLRRMAPIGEAKTLLDVGGPGPTTLMLAKHFAVVYAVDVNREFLKARQFDLSLSFFSVQADGRSLPFPDNGVDFVFADNVIEHVRNPERFAAEIRRVARMGFLITTPNYWFPFEPHFHFPFFQFLPESVKQRLLAVADFGFISRGGGEYIKLLSVSELRRLFPDATVEGIGFLSKRIPETLIVWQRE